MKKPNVKRLKSLHLALAFCLLGLTTSCLKDGLNDFDGLNYPIYLEGDFNPELGLPLCYGQATLGNLVGTLAGDGLMTFDRNDIVTISYDTVFGFAITPGANKAAKANGAKMFDSVLYERCDGSLEFGLMEAINDLDLSAIQVANLYADLNLNVRVVGTSATEDLLNRYKVRIGFDSVTLGAEGTEGDAVIVVDVEDGLLSDYVDGKTIPILNQRDVSEFINLHPSKITYTSRVSITLPDRLFANPFDLMRFMHDTLGVDSILIDADVKVKFPVSISLHNLSMGFDMPFSNMEDLQESLDEYQVSLDSSAFIVEIDNGFPIGFSVGIALVDTVTGDYASIFDGGVLNIAPSEVARLEDANTYVTSRPTKSVVRVPLSPSSYRALATSNMVRLSASVTTSPCDGGYPQVSVRKQDAMGIRLYLQLRPNIHIFVPLFGTNECDSDNSNNTNE